MSIGDAPEEVMFRDADAYDEWLALNHGRTEGVWIKIAKKDSGIASITSDEAVDVGLCWGWISSLRKAPGRHLLLAEIHPPQTEQPLEQGQHRQGQGADKRWPNEAAGAGRSRRGDR